MYMSDIITLRISHDIKNIMDAFDINWSEYMREAIQQKLVELQRERAFKEMDEIREKLKGTPPVSQEVFKWRKRR